MADIEIELDVESVMRDGTVLRADVYRPVGDGPWPVLVQRTPYFKSSPSNYSILDMIGAARRGYIVVHQDVRGTGGSEGEWLPLAHERRDGYDTVEWAASLPGSSGDVGMIGASYTGSTQWSAAITQPPSLRAVAPVVTWSDPDDGVMFRGGATELGLNSAWALIQALGQVFRSGLPADEMMAEAAEIQRSFDDLGTHGYWELPSGAQPSVVRTGQPDIGVARALDDPTTVAESRVAGNHDRIQVPSFIVGGWYDLFSQGTLDNHQALRDRGAATHLVMGPWHHYSILGASGGQTGSVNFGSGSMAPPPYASLSDLELAWYDHWLRRGPESAIHRSGVDIFVMGRNEWRSEPEWPLRRAVPTSLYLAGGEHARFDPSPEARSSSSYVYDPLDPVTTLGGAMLMTNDYPPGPMDQRGIEQRSDVLVFTTPPLEHDLEVTGQVRAVLHVESDAPSTDWVVRLCDVDESGASINIVDGIARVTATPGRITAVEVDLWSTSMLFAAGHRMRVHVTSSSFPRWDRNLNTGEAVPHATRSQTANQTVHHDSTHPSALILPVIPDEPHTRP